MAAGVCSHGSRLAAKQGGAFRREVHGLSITTATDCPWRYTAGFRTLWRVILALTSSEDVVGNGERIVPFMAIVLFRGKIWRRWKVWKIGTLIHSSIGFSVLFLLELFFFFKLKISNIILYFYHDLDCFFWNSWFLFFIFFFSIALFFSYEYFCMIFIINLFGR